MKVLFISSHFPNNRDPDLATYNRQQLSFLKRFCELKAIAPIMRFPFFKKADPPYRESIDGIEALHPRAFYIPKFGRALYGLFYFFSILKCVKSVFKDFEFEVIYTNSLYPDSFAAMLIARLFHRPFVACALGTDVNMYMKYPLRRRMILATVRRSAKAIAVSGALKERLVEEGVQPGHIEVLYDGVDKKRFGLRDRDEAKRRLGLEGRPFVILYTGNMNPQKGVGCLIDAFKILIEKRREAALYLVGDGPEMKAIERKAERELSGRVYFMKKRPHREIPLWMNAANVLCIPSVMEGIPNVMLEAWACGTPVVASDVGGIPELLDGPDYGISVRPRDPHSLAGALSEALSKRWDRGKMREYASKFSWEENAQRLHRILKEAARP